MTNEVFLRISLAALLRWHPERAEVSWHAYKVSLYFIVGRFTSCSPGIEFFPSLIQLSMYK